MYEEVDEIVKNKEKKKDSKVSKLSKLKHLMTPLTRKSKSTNTIIEGKEFRKDDETNEFVSIDNDNDRIPYYVFGEKGNEKKLQEAV